MELFAVVAAMGVALQVVVVGVVFALFPLFWVWMLVDAVLRADHEYPGSGANDKVVWVLLIALFQIVSVVYFFMVFRAVKRGSLPAPPSGVGGNATLEGSVTPAA